MSKLSRATSNSVCVLLAACALAVANATPAGAEVTYSVDRTVGTGRIAGTIQTNGKTGVLAAADIIDWNLTIDADGDATTIAKLLGPLSGGNSTFALTGMALTATPTELFYDFSVFFGFFQIITPIPNAVWQMQAGIPFTDELIQESQLPLVQGYAVRGLVKERIGAVALTPLEVTADTVLTSDHQGGVVVAADQVTLDCAGHTVRGGGSGIGIHLDGRTGVSVTHCVVSGFSEGIVLEHTSQSTLAENTVRQNSDRGIRLTSSDRNRLAGNSIVDNAGGPLAANGLILSGSSRNRVEFNTVTGTDSTGITVVDGSAANEFVGNVSSHNGGRGFDIIDALYNTFLRNTVVGNDDGGFVVRGGASHNTLRENVACLNQPSDATEEREGRRRNANVWVQNLVCNASE